MKWLIMICLFSHVYFTASPIPRSCVYLDSLAKSGFRVWACDFGLQPSSGLKMRPDDIYALDFNAATSSDGLKW